MCPEQQNKGICKLTRCPYPHQNCTVKIEQSHIEQPKRERRTKALKCPSADDIIKTHEMTSNKEEEEQTQGDDDTKLNAKRYFDGDADTNANQHKRNSKQNCDQINSTDSTSECSKTNENVEKIIVVRKPIVGSLPSFIPIG